MLSYQGIVVSVLKLSSGQEFPSFNGSPPFIPYSNTTHIAALDGEAFLVRVKVPARFDWAGSNVLAIGIDYSLGDRFYQYPNIVKPDLAHEITLDLVHCFLWSACNHTWVPNITQFVRSKACSPHS